MKNLTFSWKSPVSLVIVLSLVAFAPAVATAQEPIHDWQRVQSGLRMGDTIRMEGVDGKRVEGTVDSISASSLTMKIKGVSHEFHEPQVREIKVRYTDSIWNGVTWGAIVGAISGVVVGAALGDAFCDGCGNGDGIVGGAVTLGIFGLGIGAGSGAAGDFFKKSYTSVFVAQPTTGKHFGVSPILSKDKKAVAVAYRF